MPSKDKRKRRTYDSSDSDSEDDRRRRKRHRRDDYSSDSDSDSSSDSSSSESSDSDSRRRRKKKDKKKRSKSSRKDKKKKSKKKKKKDKKKSKKDKKKSKKSKSSSSDKKAERKEPEKIVIPPDEKVGAIKLVARTNFGLCEKKILKVGTGRRPVRGQEATVQCDGYLQDKMKKFWSTRDKYGKPYKFRVGCGKVIKGWDDGVLKMRLGEKARLTITGRMGYGMEGYPAWGIPSMATLLMDIEIVHISEDIVLPTNEELMKMRMAKKPKFIDRTGDRLGDSLRFNSAPF